MPILSNEISTEDLINDYKQAHSRFKVVEEALKQRAIEESGFKVGDIIKLVPRQDADQNQWSARNINGSEHIISSLVGEIESWTGKTELSVKAYTRKRTKSGAWHGIKNERYKLDGISQYGAPFWQVVGHEDIKEQP